MQQGKEPSGLSSGFIAVGIFLIISVVYSRFPTYRCSSAGCAIWHNTMKSSYLSSFPRTAGKSAELCIQDVLDGRVRRRWGSQAEFCHSKFFLSSPRKFNAFSANSLSLSLPWCLRPEASPVPCRALIVDFHFLINPHLLIFYIVFVFYSRLPIAITFSFFHL